VRGGRLCKETPGGGRKSCEHRRLLAPRDAFAPSWVGSTLGSRTIRYPLQVFKQSMKTTVGVLALQGAFIEHLALLRKAADFIGNLRKEGRIASSFDFIQVRTPRQLSLCDALIIPGGESTTISLVAAASGLLEPLRDFVKYDSCPVHLS
jgi:hypothetical protein